MKTRSLFAQRSVSTLAVLAVLASSLPACATETPAASKEAQADAIISAAYQDPKPARWLQQRTGEPAVVLPITVGGNATTGAVGAANRLKGAAAAAGAW